MWSFITTRGQRVPLARLPAVVGRDRDAADVVLPHPSIRPAHARVVADGDVLSVVALDDAPLAIGGRPTSEGRLAHGDDVTIGALVLRLQDDARGEVEPPTRAAAAAGRASGAPTTTPPEIRPRSAATPTTAPVLRERSPTRDAGLVLRTRAPLRSERPAEKSGLLHVDLEQLHPLARFGVLALLLGVAALLTWGLAAGIAALP